MSANVLREKLIGELARFGLRLNADDTIRRAITDSALGRLHDVVFEASGRSITIDQIYDLVDALPPSITNEAVTWGWDDTCVCDEVYTWVQTNPLP